MQELISGYCFGHFDPRDGECSKRCALGRMCVERTRRLMRTNKQLQSSLSPFELFIDILEKKLGPRICSMERYGHDTYELRKFTNNENCFVYRDKNESIKVFARKSKPDGTFDEFVKEYDKLSDHEIAKQIGELILGKL